MICDIETLECITAEELIKTGTDVREIWKGNFQDAAKSLICALLLSSDKFQSSFSSNAILLHPLHKILLDFREDERRNHIKICRTTVAPLSHRYKGDCSEEKNQEILREEAIQLN